MPCIPDLNLISQFIAVAAVAASSFRPVSKWHTHQASKLALSRESRHPCIHIISCFCVLHLRWSTSKLLWSKSHDSPQSLSPFHLGKFGGSRSASWLSQWSRMGILESTAMMASLPVAMSNLQVLQRMLPIRLGFSCFQPDVALQSVRFPELSRN